MTLLVEVVLYRQQFLCHPLIFNLTHKCRVDRPKASEVCFGTHETPMAMNAVVKDNQQIHARFYLVLEPNIGASTIPAS